MIRKEHKRGYKLKQHEAVIAKKIEAFNPDQDQHEVPTILELVCMDQAVLQKLCNTKFQNGDTLLHTAANFPNKLELCEQLVDAGALLKAENSKKELPVDVARKKRHCEIVRLL